MPFIIAGCILFCFLVLVNTYADPTTRTFSSIAAVILTIAALCVWYGV